MTQGLERLVRLAIADLASRTGMAAGDIRVVEAQAVTWPDTALGCRQPGMRYRQVPQDGARVVLEAAGVRYHYHAGGHRTDPFLCRQQPDKTAGPRRRLDPRLPDETTHESGDEPPA